MDTLFAAAPDGMRVAYDRCGTGPAIVLLHGGGGSRQEWHEAGYVERLRDSFTVIAVDLRGHGESAKPTDPADYTLDKMGQDVMAAADACGVEHFTIWAMSYGAKIGRHLAVHSERVEKAILMGAQLGLGVSGKLRLEAIDFCAHWPPIVQAQHEGKLDLGALSQQDRDFLRTFDVPVMLGWVRAMLDWPTIVPADFRCPTLWILGSEDQQAMASVKEYEKALKGSQVRAHIVAGLNHEQVFEYIDRVFITLLNFTQS
jgi:pimeloyl-ACP methyl ester carboxylesterase